MGLQNIPSSNQIYIFMGSYIYIGMVLPIGQLSSHQGCTPQRGAVLNLKQTHGFIQIIALSWLFLWSKIVWH